MTKVTVKLTDEARRRRAIHYIMNAPEGYVVTIGEATRTGDQNALMWALLNDVARAKPDGRDMRSEAWKACFMDAIGQKPKMVQNLDGDSIVCLGYKSSALSKTEFSDLLECIMEYGARKDIKFAIPEERFSDYF